MMPFLSTLSLRRATRGSCFGRFLAAISIHALLAESDVPARAPAFAIFISIHALLAESDPPQVAQNSKALISIHALLAESDRPWACLAGFVCLFLSTLSLRRATEKAGPASCANNISIHALLAESDMVLLLLRIPKIDFYPRSPCGERPRRPGQTAKANNFYPRSPCGERRKPRRLKSRRCVFLSTLSLRRATFCPVACSTAVPNFYPRSPCGERPVCLQSAHLITNFYPRSPCGERPVVNATVVIIHSFLSTLSLRRATSRRCRRCRTL